MKTHRQSRTRLWWVWCAMKQRCRNPKSKDYADYGGRGITVCDRWLAYEAFVEDMGPRPPRAMLERNDNDGPYSPDNCRWATPTEQARNRRRRQRGSYAVGANNGAARLTPEKVFEARALAGNGESFGSIARRLGVSRMTITRAVRGETWGAL